MTATFTLNRSRTSTYVCHACRKRTRETGLGEMQLDLCAYCFEVASNENSLSDGYITAAEFDAIVAKLDKKYGRNGAAWNEPAAPVVEAAPVPAEIAAKRSAAARKANETRRRMKLEAAAAAAGGK